MKYKGVAAAVVIIILNVALVFGIFSYTALNRGEVTRYNIEVFADDGQSYKLQVPLIIDEDDKATQLSHIMADNHDENQIQYSDKGLAMQVNGKGNMSFEVEQDAFSFDHTLSMQNSSNLPIKWAEDPDDLTIWIYCDGLGSNSTIMVTVQLYHGHGEISLISENNHKDYYVHSEVSDGWNEVPLDTEWLVDG